MEHLRKMREDKKMTQLELSLKVGIDQSLLSKFERNERRPSFEHLLILAEFFNTSVDYLMDITDNPRPYPKGNPKQNAGD